MVFEHDLEVKVLVLFNQGSEQFFVLAHKEIKGLFSLWIRLPQLPAHLQRSQIEPPEKSGEERESTARRLRTHPAQNSSYPTRLNMTPDKSRNAATISKHAPLSAR